MGKRLNDKSRDILAYRPKINFVEPDIEPGEILAKEEPPQREEISNTREKVKGLAKAVNTLATAVQARVDQKAKDMIIQLDPVTDAAVVQSVKRMYGHEPGMNPNQITYTQYKECKERMRKKGEELGARMKITEEDLAEARNKISAPTGAVTASITEGYLPNIKNPFVQFGGANTPAASNGGLRPELNKKAMIIDPIDMDVLQSYLVRIFVNAIWEKFIRPVFPDFVKDILPEELAEIPADGFSAEELVALGVPVFGYEKPEQAQPDTGATPEDI